MTVSSKPIQANSPQDVCHGGTCQNQAVQGERLCAKCKEQWVRVDAFLAIHKKKPIQIKPVPAPKGFEWFCQACASIQPRPGTHCDGIRTIMIEAKSIEQDSRRRIITVAQAENLTLYRKAKAGSLPENWQVRRK
jgi:hypothetical protein